MPVASANSAAAPGNGTSASGGSSSGGAPSFGACECGDGEAAGTDEAAARQRARPHTALAAAMHRYAEAVVAMQAPPSPGVGEPRLTRAPANDWSKQAEDYAQYLMLRPSACIDDVAVVIMLSEIDATKNRKNAAPTPMPVRSVALGLAGGYGQPIDARLNCHYE